MKTLILSDLHLGSPLFNSQSEIIEILNEKHKEVFIIGDIIDIWEDNIDKILLKHKGLIDKIIEKANKCRVVIIKGNHDPNIDALQNIFPNCTIKNKCAYIGDHTILIHGDEFDYLTKHHIWISKIFFFIHKIFERLLGINLRESFRYMLYTLMSIFYIGQKNYFKDIALKVEKDTCDGYKLAFKNIVMGHTHLPKIVCHYDKKSGKNYKYVNAGDWVYNKTYIIYIERQDEFFMHETKR